MRPPGTPGTALSSGHRRHATAQFAYDGLKRRVAPSTRKAAISITARIGKSSKSARQVAQYGGARPPIRLGPAYIDKLILRDRTTDAGTLAERLYALQDANGMSLAYATPRASSRSDSRPPTALSNSSTLTSTQSVRPPTPGKPSTAATATLAAVGLLIARNRCINPSLGCWLSNDPLTSEDDANSFRYVGAESDNVYRSHLAWQKIRILPFL